MRYSLLSSESLSELTYTTIYNINNFLVFKQLPMNKKHQFEEQFEDS